jgi:hypothetical protein
LILTETLSKERAFLFSMRPGVTETHPHFFTKKRMTMPHMRKKSARPAMSMKSLYGKTACQGCWDVKGQVPHAHCRDLPTSKQPEEDEARENASLSMMWRGWVRNTLGQKKDASSPPCYLLKGVVLTSIVGLGPRASPKP